MSAPIDTYDQSLIKEIEDRANKYVEDNLTHPTEFDRIFVLNAFM